MWKCSENSLYRGLICFKQTLQYQRSSKLSHLCLNFLTENYSLLLSTCSSMRIWILLYISVSLDIVITEYLHPFQMTQTSKMNILRAAVFLKSKLIKASGYVLERKGKKKGREKERKGAREVCETSYNWKGKFSFFLQSTKIMTLFV